MSKTSEQIDVDERNRIGVHAQHKKNIYLGNLFHSATSTHAPIPPPAHSGAASPPAWSGGPGAAPCCASAPRLHWLSHGIPLFGRLGWDGRFVVSFDRLGCWRCCFVYFWLETETTALRRLWWSQHLQHDACCSYCCCCCRRPSSSGAYYSCHHPRRRRRARRPNYPPVGPGRMRRAGPWPKEMAAYM